MEIYWKTENQDREITSALSKMGVKVHQGDAVEGLEAGLWMKSEVVCIGAEFFKKKEALAEWERCMRTYPIPFIVIDREHNDERQRVFTEMGTSDYIASDVLTSPLLSRSLTFALSKHRAHKLLLAERERYANLFNHSLDPIFLCDFSFKLVDANSAFQSYLGLKQDRVKRLNIKDFIKSFNHFDEVREQLSEKGFVRKIPVKAIDQNGEEKKCLLSITRLKKNTLSGDYYQAMLHDLSEIEEALHDRRMAEKMMLTGKFARMIAHEVRNPLTNINLSAQQLKSDVQEHDHLPEDLSSSATLYLEIIERNSTRINKLINDMLEISKPKSLSLVKTNLGLVVKDAVALIQDRLTLREVGLRMEMKIDPELYLDAKHLSIAFLNILTNAVEAMETIEEPMLSISVDEAKEKGEIELCFEDNGIGMSQDQVENLFEPFSTGKSNGLGLGMTTTQNVLRDHGARILVESQLGEGSRFRIFFKQKPRKS